MILIRVRNRLWALWTRLIGDGYFNCATSLSFFGCLLSHIYVSSANQWGSAANAAPFSFWAILAVAHECNIMPCRYRSIAVKLLWLGIEGMLTNMDFMPNIFNIGISSQPCTDVIADPNITVYYFPEWSYRPKSKFLFLLSLPLRLLFESLMLLITLTWTIPTPSYILVQVLFNPLYFALV